MVRNESVGDEIVSMPVPARLVPLVYRVVAEALARDTGGESRRDTAQAESGQWSKDDIERLKKEVTSRTVRSLFDACAEHPGQWVAFADICARAGHAPDTARAELGGFTKLLKRRFGRNNWPTEWQWKPGGSSYLLSPELATWWLEG